MNYENIGQLPIEGCDSANIPVNCFINPPDDENEKWRWVADNFMPRKGRCSESAYEIQANSKEELIEVVKHYVSPLYKVALENLETTGKNYYWETEK